MENLEPPLLQLFARPPELTPANDHTTTIRTLQPNQEPLNLTPYHSYLMRPRKSFRYDENTGVEHVINDLMCCGVQHQSTYACNQHYLQTHADLPLTDPLTWSHIRVRDIKKHVELNIKLPFVPFPAGQPSTSTWTIISAARSKGSWVDRHLTREAKRNQVPALKSRIARLEKDLKASRVAIRDAGETIKRCIQDTTQSMIALPSETHNSSMQSDILNLRERNIALDAEVRALQTALDVACIPQMHTKMQRMQDLITENGLFMERQGLEIDVLKSKNINLELELEKCRKVPRKRCR